MSGDKRRHRRRSIDRRAVLRTLDGGHLCDCTLSDISAGGARITLDRSGPLPQQFTLCLTDDGTVSRECKVAWRRENTVGLQFASTHVIAISAPVRGGFRFHG